MNRKGQIVTKSEAVPAKGQHSSPCADCPWARKSVNGWLGGHDPQTWIMAAHGEEKIDCHTLLGAQCAGSAIYRSNIVKRPRDPEVLRLPADAKKVFSSPVEFMAHHAEKPKMAKSKNEKPGKAKKVVKRTPASSGKTVDERLEAVRDAIAEAFTGIEGDDYEVLAERILSDADCLRDELRDRALERGEQ